MKTVIEGVLQGDLPWGLVLTGAALALTAELLSVPSLPFAVGIYLPLATMTPVFVGGVVRHFIEKTASTEEERASHKERGVLFGSGLIAGEGIIGVLIAGYAVIAGRPAGLGWITNEVVGQVVSLLVFATLVLLLVNKAVKKS